MKYDRSSHETVSLYKNISERILQVIISNLSDQFDFWDLNIPPNIPSNIYIVCIDEEDFKVRYIFDITRHGPYFDYRYDVCQTVTLCSLTG